MRCDKCIYWKGCVFEKPEGTYHSNYGNCHFALPAIADCDSNVWPETKRDDFCGKFTSEFPKHVLDMEHRQDEITLEEDDE